MDEDGIGRVKRDGGVRGLAEIGRASIEEVAWWPSKDGRFGPQNHRAGRFLSLGIKTRGASGVAGLRRWRARGAILKFASRQSQVVKAAVCPMLTQKDGPFCPCVGSYPRNISRGILVIHQTYYIDRHG